MKIGDTKGLRNDRGEDFIVKVVDLFTYDGTKYAEVAPVDFQSFTREVPADILYSIKFVYHWSGGNSHKDYDTYKEARNRQLMCGGTVVKEVVRIDD